MMDTFETVVGHGAQVEAVEATGPAPSAQPPRPMPGFDEFYAREWLGAVRLAALLTQHNGAAEDLAQDALTRVMPRWVGLDNPEAYLRTALVNECRKWHRRHRLERSKLPLLLGRAAYAPGGSELTDAVRALPYRQRAVLVLRYYADLPEAAIAAALGCRPGTVKSLAARALAQLHKEIER